MIAVRKRLSINIFRATGRAGRDSSTRGQGLVESALVLPILLLLLAFILEGGLALNAWLRVNTAARDATRFALDGGRNSDIASLVISKLVWMDGTQINVYVIHGQTNNSGAVTTWTPTHVYGASSGGPRITTGTIQQRLVAANNPNRNMRFTIVEVDYVYVPTFIRVLTGARRIHMMSYAIVHRL